MIGDGFLDSEGFAVSAGCLRFRFVTWTRPLGWPPFVGPDIQMNFYQGSWEDDMEYVCKAH